MTIYFVSRHPGASDWAAGEGVEYDRLVTHLDPERIMHGDTVIGSLPVNLAATVCSRGAHYFHLTLDLPAELRGRELDADQLRELGAHLEPYRVEPVR